MKKIYDGFTFFNELDVLELRLEEMYRYVDVIVLVESDHTFTNIPKPYYFEENKQRYTKYLDKIRHIKITSNCDVDPWVNERYQRDAIMRGCEDACDDDLIMISDVDEIVRPSAMERIIQSNSDVLALEMPCFYYKLNFVDPKSTSMWTMVGRPSIIRSCTAQAFRDARAAFQNDPNYKFSNAQCEVIRHAGWHFSYLGDNEFVKRKFVSYSHAGDQDPTYVNNFNMDVEIYSSGNGRAALRVDEYFPNTILADIDKYRKYLVLDAIEYPVEYVKHI